MKKVAVNKRDFDAALRNLLASPPLPKERVMARKRATKPTTKSSNHVGESKMGVFVAHAEVNKKINGVVRDIPKNTRRISRRLNKVGAKVDTPIVFSAAKYFEALKKLAKE